MDHSDSPTAYTAFAGHRRIASGALPAVAVAAKQALRAHPSEPVFIYSDATGELIDLDLRGSDAEVAARFTPAAAPQAQAVPEARGRGRPKLGVVSREVTLLPRHWDWLASQPGGASVALRKLVEEARRSHAASDRSRQRQEAAYRYMVSMAGDLPGFEEAARALFASDAARYAEQTAAWPADVRDHAAKLAFGN